MNINNEINSFFIDPYKYTSSHVKFSFIINSIYNKLIENKLLNAEHSNLDDLLENLLTNLTKYIDEYSKYADIIQSLNNNDIKNEDKNRIIACIKADGEIDRTDEVVKEEEEDLLGGNIVEDENGIENIDMPENVYNTLIHNNSKLDEMKNLLKKYNQYQKRIFKFNKTLLQNKDLKEILIRAENKLESLLKEKNTNLIDEFEKDKIEKLLEIENKLESILQDKKFNLLDEFEKDKLEKHYKLIDIENKLEKTKLEILGTILNRDSILIDKLEKDNSERNLKLLDIEKKLEAIDKKSYLIEKERDLKISFIKNKFKKDKKLMDIDNKLEVLLKKEYPKSKRDIKHLIMENNQNDYFLNVSNNKLDKIEKNIKKYSKILKYYD